MKTSWAIVKDRALWLNSMGKSIWRLAYGVWRLAFGVWRLAFGVWRCRESFNVQRPCSRSILEISPSPYFHSTALTNVKRPNAHHGTGKPQPGERKENA